MFYIIYILNLLIVRKQKEEDEEIYKNAEKLWLDQRSEIENELKEAKDLIEIVGTYGCISYDGVNSSNAILLISLNHVNYNFANIFINEIIKQNV